MSGIGAFLGGFAGGARTSADRSAMRTLLSNGGASGATGRSLSGTGAGGALWGEAPPAGAGGAPGRSLPASAVSGDYDGVGLPPSLIQSESSGDWNASNDVAGSGGIGHFGRGQFSQGRLQDAMNAGVIPQGTTPQAFLADPDMQARVETWHVQDINRFIDSNGLRDYVGQTINGQTVTPNGMIAVAHLGGNGGLRRYLTSGGSYNPSDVYGTSLSDYMASHAGAPVEAARPALTEGRSLPEEPVLTERQPGWTSTFLRNRSAAR